MTFERTFKLERLYHQLMKPRGIPLEDLPIIVGLMVEHGFISLMHLDRYAELEKLSSGKNKKELFKILQGLAPRNEERMRTAIKTMGLVVICLYFTACSSMPKLKDMNAVSIGMTKSQVIEELGQPTSTENEGALEMLHYSVKDEEGEIRPRLVVLKDGEVTYSGKPSGFTKPKVDDGSGQDQRVNVTVNPVNNINIGSTGQEVASHRVPQASNIEGERDQTIASRLEALNKRFPGIEHNCYSGPIYGSAGQVLRYDVDCY